jgi:hypothetical protein
MTYLNFSADDPLQIQENYDLVVSSHVTEHLRESRKHLHNIRLLLRDHRAASVASPNLTSCDAKRLGKRWRGYIDPTHISLTGIDEMRRMCELEEFSIRWCGSSLYPKSPKEIFSFLLDWEFTFRDSGKGESCSFLLRK